MHHTIVKGPTVHFYAVLERKMDICGLGKPDLANPDKIGHPAGLILNPDESFPKSLRPDLIRTKMARQEG